MWQRADWVGEPQRGAFGHAWMIDMRPVWRGVRSKVPVDEAAAVRGPERPPMHVLWWQYRGGQQADQGDQHSRSMDRSHHRMGIIGVCSGPRQVGDSTLLAYRLPGYTCRPANGRRLPSG